MMNYQKYRRNPVIDYPERQWPGKEIEKAPIWCSVDLRDGNQALVDPMVVEEKIEMFQYLIKLGFKEIEVGFPAASQIEFDFLRHLIEHDMIPDDVYVQVLTQCREELIARTFESIQGCKQAIVHIYNSTSTLQRDVVFHMDRSHIVDIAVKGTELVKKYAADFPGKIVLEYSPESFTGTELDFALEICTAVQKTWGATKENPIIINLPSTVEMNTPNVYADQIEWMNRHFENRESIILSIHPHNDRGTGVASAELALLAGAERVEGTLFGNGERTGNVDVLNIAYNMFSQGINPELEIGHVNDIIGIYERCCKIPIHPRHPYAGKLVFTAFSGSHQDAINKGVKAMHKEFANVIQKISEKQGEVSPQQIMDNFKREYLDQKEPLHFKKLRIEDLSGDVESGEFDTKVIVDYTLAGKPGTFDAVGNGPIDAVKRGLQVTFGMNIRVLDYEEHALQNGSNAQAAAYIHMMDAESGRVTYGVGVSSNITRASVRAMFSAVNRLELVTGV